MVEKQQSEKKKYNNNSNKKNSNLIAVWEFMFWMLHVSLMVCLYILPTDYV